MNLKNDALQELYDTLTYGPVLSSPYTESPIDRAFKECDEKLSGSATFAHIKALEDRCENLERSNKALRDDNDKLGDKVIELNKKKEQLEKDINVCKCSNDMLLAGSMESISEKRKLEKEIEDLKKERDAKTKENATLISANADLSDRNAKLQRNFDRINHLWTSQIQENMELRSKIANLQEPKPKLVDYEALRKELDDANSQLNYYKNSYYDLVSRAHRAEDEVEDLKKRINSIYGTTTRRLADALRKNGMYELWRKLQEVGDATRADLLGCFSDVCDIDDLVEWELEDFLDEYNEWQKKKKNEKYFEKARVYGQVSSPVEGVNKAISKACEDFCNAVRDTDNKIIENLRKGGTLEAKVEIDKDLLEKVCGVKPEEEEHKLDYGDAVRVPWQDYDYMYIGPEGKHIRLFDPKTHTVVVVSVTDNLTYQGCKIILCDEDDIRKIWKDKK